uniref:Uncharacterized protein n=1 Tax=Trichogramma kaykai TaxID=54128 RepID=A0ABD2WSQ6_9HYME
MDVAASSASAVLDGLKNNRISKLALSKFLSQSLPVTPAIEEKRNHSRPNPEEKELSIENNDYNYTPFSFLLQHLFF